MRLSGRPGIAQTSMAGLARIPGEPGRCTIRFELLAPKQKAKQFRPRRAVSLQTSWCFHDCAATSWSWGTRTSLQFTVAPHPLHATLPGTVQHWCCGTTDEDAAKYTNCDGKRLLLCGAVTSILGCNVDLSIRGFVAQRRFRSISQESASHFAVGRGRDGDSWHQQRRPPSVSARAADPHTSFRLLTLAWPAGSSQ